MIGTERSEVQWGRTQIPYLIRRSARRGTVSVAVEPSGQVVLTAPAVTTVERLDRVVRQKARWIVERTRRAGAVRGPTTREFVSGETHLYLGKHYRLRVVPAAKAGRVRLLRGWIVVTTSEQFSDAERSSDVRKQLVNWYRSHALNQLRERTHAWSVKLRMQDRNVLIRDPQSRWGSCDKSGTVRFSWRIVQAPSRLIDYVVLHELIHLLHRNHTPKFWSEVGRSIPNYEALRKHLRALGPSLVW
jgi:hypothetical protein